MAGITGVFTADFKSFYDAVAQARVKLKDFQSDAEAVAQKVDKVANAFSGRKLVQDAEIMTKAILEIGGATRLTADEQGRVNAKLTEAIEKYKALGQTAPKEMQDLEKATRQVTTETGKTSTSLTGMGEGLIKMAGAIGIALSAEAIIGGVINIGKEAFATAGKIQDLSEKIGISAKAVQTFGFNAEQTGATIEDVASAIGKMNEKLASGDKSTVFALKDLKLSLDDLRQMSPEQAFETITTALQKTETQGELTRGAFTLLGEAGVKLSSAIKAGIGKVGDDVTLMTDDTVKRLADAEDAWENLRKKVVIVTGEMIAKVLDWENFKRSLPGGQFMGPMAGGVPGVREGAAATETWDVGTGARVFTGGGAGKDVHLGTTKGTAAGAEERARLAREQKAAIDELRRAEEEYAKLLAGDVLKAYEETRKALEAYYLIILKANTGITAGVEGLTFRKNTEVNILNGLTGQWLAYLDAVNSVNSKVVTGLDSAPGQKVDTDFLAGIWGKDETKARENELKKAEAFGRDLASRIIGGLRSGNVFASVGSMIGGSLGDSIGAALSKSIGGKLGSMLGGMLGPLGALGGELIGKLGDKLFGKLFGKGQGREAVEAFAEGMGGFDALQKQLEALGEEGARLWVKLTQGTDKGNIDQAKKNIKEVEDALRKHEEATEDVTGATEEQARATIETASEAERAMKALEPLLKANEDQWRAWGDVVNGQIDRVASALRSLALPNLSGAAVTQSAPNSGSGGGTAVINLDSRQIAEAVVPRIPGVVRRYGLA